MSLAFFKTDFQATLRVCAPQELQWQGALAPDQTGLLDTTMYHFPSGARRAARLPLDSFIALAVSTAMITGLSGTAVAVPAKLKRECRQDYKSLCPHYKIGTSKMRACMRANGRQLSWDCYQSLKDHGYVKRR